MVIPKLPGRNILWLASLGAAYAYYKKIPCEWLVAGLFISAVYAQVTDFTKGFNIIDSVK